MAIQLQNSGQIESKKIQIFQFTDNGFLLDTCDTIVNLLKYRSSSLYDLLPFLKRYYRVIKGLEEGEVKQFKGIRLDFNEKNHLLNVAFSRYNGQLTCMLEAVSYTHLTLPTICSV